MKVCIWEACTCVFTWGGGSSGCFGPIKQEKTNKPPEWNNHGNFLFNLSEQSTGIVSFWLSFIVAPWHVCVVALFLPKRQQLDPRLSSCIIQPRRQQLWVSHFQIHHPEKGILFFTKQKCSTLLLFSCLRFCPHLNASLRSVEQLAGFA